MAVLNLVPGPQRIEVDWAQVPVPPGQAPTELAAMGVTVQSTPSGLTLDLPGYGYAWLQWQTAE